MKTDKLMDALNYIDDDLIANCDEVRLNAQNKAVKPAKKKMSRARVTAIWGSVAAAALVLIVGFAVITLNSRHSKDTSSKRHKNHSVSKSEEVKEDISFNGGESAEEIKDEVSAEVEFNTDGNKGPNQTVQGADTEDPEFLVNIDVSGFITGTITAHSGNYSRNFFAGEIPGLAEEIRILTTNAVPYKFTSHEVLYTIDLWITFSNEEDCDVTFYLETIGDDYYLVYYDCSKEFEEQTMYSITEEQAMELISIIHPDA